MAEDRAIVKITTYCEASSLSGAARRAVVHSIFNRVRLGAQRYGSTPAAVCLKRMQYSEWNADLVDNRNLERAGAAPDSDPVMLDCGAAFDEVSGGAPDTTDGATHFYATSIPAPYWAPQATKTVEIDGLAFFKDVP